MNIITTSIPDIDKDNLNREKLEIGERIVESVKPLLDDEYKKKKDRVKELVIEIKQERTKVLGVKERISRLMKQYEREKKINKLLNLISKLVSTGLVHKGQMRNEIIVLLKTLDKVQDSKLDQHLSQVQRNFSKRFA